MNIFLVNSTGIGWDNQVGAVKTGNRVAEVARNAGTSLDTPPVILNLKGSIKSDPSEAVYSRRGVLDKKESLQGGSGEEQEIKELEARDREVRLHEQTHVALLGQYALGGPSYIYEVGPDGRLYAVGGSVEADSGTESTPEANAAKARTLRMAAIGVAEPSSSDMSAVVSAARLESGVGGKQG